MSGRSRFSIQRILHPTDFSHGSEVAFAHSLRLAFALKATLSILHVDRERHRPDWDQYPSVRETLSRWNLIPADASRADVAKLGMDVSKSAVADSSPAHGILHYLESHQADLLVLATHQRHGLDRWLHQNIAGTINNKSDGATLFIPYGKTGFVDQESGACRLKRILLPVDLTPDPAPTVKLIADLVKVLECESCEIILLHVGDPAAQPAVKLPVLSGVHWQWSNREGGAIAAILEEASDRSVDLIAMTTSGRHGFLDAIRGSTTEQIVELAMCPVLAVHEA